MIQVDIFIRIDMEYKPYGTRDDTRYIFEVLLHARNLGSHSGESKLNDSHANWHRTPNP
jgi:hypothetical protein